MILSPAAMSKVPGVASRHRGQPNLRDVQIRRGVTAEWLASGARSECPGSASVDPERASDGAWTRPETLRADLPGAILGQNR